MEAQIDKSYGDLKPTNFDTQFAINIAAHKNWD